MRRAITGLCLLLLSLGLYILPAYPATAQTKIGATSVTLPDTPAGKRFAAWLAAVNSGNRDTLRQFIGANFAPPPNGTLPVDSIVNRHFGIYTNTLGPMP
jgi:hypothetical protein